MLRCSRARRSSPALAPGPRAKGRGAMAWPAPRCARAGTSRAVEPCRVKWSSDRDRARSLQTVRLALDRRLRAGAPSPVPRRKPLDGLQPDDLKRENIGDRTSRAHGGAHRYALSKSAIRCLGFSSAFLGDAFESLRQPAQGETVGRLSASSRGALTTSSEPLRMASIKRRSSAALLDPGSILARYTC